MEFEWDPSKAASNKQKHKIDFEMAVKAFDDIFCYETDELNDDDVIRFKLTGMVEGRLLVVVYTMRGDLCRTISARLADRHEGQRYHEV